MKKISVFRSQLEAKMAADVLITQGIEAEVQGHKDYASIKLGSDIGKFNLLVKESDEAQASQILKEIQNTPIETFEKSPSYHLRRAIIFPIAGMIILPIIPNIFSIRHVLHYMKLQTDSVSKCLIVALLVLLQLASVFPWIFLLVQALN